jgi:hypothetical protein
MLPGRDRWCVEFGAWDGVHLSNVRKLVLEDKYNAIFIEGDKAKCDQIARNYAGLDVGRIHPLNAFVGYGPSDGLDGLLAAYEIPKTFDFLSIDIDGNDFHVWKAVREYRPKVVCIEFNPTIPTEVDFVQERHPAISQGCSLKALYRLAEEKGYQAVCVLPWNVIFADAKYFDLFDIAENSAATMRKDLSQVTWIFSGYDGSIHFQGAKKLPWHGIPLDESSIKGVPELLRVYPDNYSLIQRLYFYLHKLGRLASSATRSRNS